MSKIISKTIAVEQCSVHFLDIGDTTGLDIILLHGMKFQAGTWQELGTLQVLAGSGMRAMAVDMPGFGLSPACVLEQDAVLHGFVEGQTSGKPILLGPSMGGRIALEFALGHPDLVSGLILVGAVGVEENRKRLAEIKVPTLLIWGGEDQISPLVNSDTLLAEISGAKRVVIDGAPHPCYLDHAKQFHSTIQEFVSSFS